MDLGPLTHCRDRIATLRSQLHTLARLLSLSALAVCLGYVRGLFAFRGLACLLAAPP